MAAPAPAVESTLTFTRTIQAPVAEVYAAFTNLDRVGNWLSYDARVRAEVDRPMYLYWRDGSHATAIFREVEENKRLVFDWRTQYESDWSSVTVELAEKGDATALTLTHSGMADAAVDTYQTEWDRSLDGLVMVLETGVDPYISQLVIVGIIAEQPDEAELEKLELSLPGPTRISRVLDGFSAAEAGLQAGDLIIGAEGRKFDNEWNIRAAAEGKKPGDVVNIKYYRDGEKQKVDVTLRGYPIPEVPATFAALADRYAGEQAGFLKRLDEALAGATEDSAAAAPAEGEWSVRDVFAHFILNERWLQNWIGGFMQGNRTHGYTCNTPARIASIRATYPSLKAVRAEFERACKETIELIRAISDEEFGVRRSNIWWMSFELNQFIWHLDGHLPQIKDALAAAKKAA